MSIFKFQFPSNGKVERKNSLFEIRSADATLAVSIPFKRESRAQGEVEEELGRTELYLLVSIPFKRESRAQDYPRVVLDFDVYKFQFPSNGKVERKCLHPLEKGAYDEFQFPSNGKVERKT